MKKVLNKKTEDGTKYLEIILTALRTPENPDKGANYAEMEKVMPVIQQVNAALELDHILLEESDFDIILPRLKNLPFVNINESVYTMIQEISSSKTTEVKER